MDDTKRDTLAKIRARMGLAPFADDAPQEKKTEELKAYLQSDMNADRMKAVHNPQKHWDSYTAHADHDSLMLTDELLSLAMSAILVGVQDGDFPLKYKRSVLIRAENMLSAMIDMVTQANDGLCDPDMLNAVKATYMTIRQGYERDMA